MATHTLPQPGNEAERRRVLRTHKIMVTSLLGAMALVFLLCSWWQSQHDAPEWVGFVRAAAEAGMVGGLADWFAVTALFRHPLGLPIPHTAIIPRKKDQVAGALSDFVSENFLNAQTITEKVSEARIPERVGKWMAQPANAERISEHAGSFAVRAVRSIDPAEAERVINAQVINRVAEPTWAPPLGRALEGLINDGKVDPIVDDVIAWGVRKVEGMEDTVVTMIDERMPVWAPKFAKNLVGERVYRELLAFMREVEADPQHDARRSVRGYIEQFSRDLQFDPAMISRVEAIKADIMGSNAVSSAASGIWEQASRALIDAASDPSSALRRKVASLSMEWGHKLLDDPRVREDAQRRLAALTRYLAENGAGEIVSIISETIQRWDGREASDKIELMVGKDLQFIRLNGTVVGALAGLAIYTVAHILFP